MCHPCETRSAKRQMSHLLREFVELIVERAVRRAQLSNDREVDWGSDDHLSDLEERLRAAEYWRDKYPRGTEKRGHYRNVCSHLKRELQSARRKNQTALNEKQRKSESM